MPARHRDSSPEPRTTPWALVSMNTHGGPSSPLWPCIPTWQQCLYPDSLAAGRLPCSLGAASHGSTAFPGKPAVCTRGEGSIPHPLYLRPQNKQDFLLQSSCRRNPARHPGPAQEKTSTTPLLSPSSQSLETPTNGSSHAGQALQGAQAQQQPPSASLPSGSSCLCSFPGRLDQKYPAARLGGHRDHPMSSLGFPCWTRSVPECPTPGLLPLWRRALL